MHVGLAVAVSSRYRRLVEHSDRMESSTSKVHQLLDGDIETVLSHHSHPSCVNPFSYKGRMYERTPYGDVRRDWRVLLAMIAVPGH